LPKLGLSREPGFLPNSKMEHLLQKANNEVKLKCNDVYGLVRIVDRFTKPPKLEDLRTITTALYLSEFKQARVFAKVKSYLEHLY